METATTTQAPSPRYRITPDPPGPAEALRELVAGRGLLGLLLGRELRVRYKQTALGLGWVILQPLIPALIFAVIFGAFARLPSAGSPYLLFALAGMVIFVLFSAAANRAGTSFLRDGALLTKVHFPLSLLPLAAGSSALVDFGVGLVVLVGIGLFFGILPGAPMLVVPLVALGALGLGLGLGLAIAALSSRYRDFAIALPFLLQLLLYASPVVYSLELIPASAQAIYALNPLVALIETFRWALLGTPLPTAWQVGAGLVTGFVATLLGLLVYRRLSRDLTDVI
jgi:lipopolysaccharide transport system permease protein